jgi:hypothetical protein
VVVPLQSNGLHDVENISTLTALSSDYLPAIFEVISDVRREIISYFVFDYNNANKSRFHQVLDPRLVLDFSLDRIERESEIDSMRQGLWP